MKTVYLIWAIAAASSQQGGLANGVSSGSREFHSEAACQHAAQEMSKWSAGTWVKADCFADEVAKQ